VHASSLREARAEAKTECGRNDPPRNVHLASKDEIAFRKGMGDST
jgi:hypothetical protein